MFSLLSFQFLTVSALLSAFYRIRSNAQWTGVLLRDVLEAAGLSEADIESGKVRHVQFSGLDRDMTGSCYGSSIPVDKAWDKSGDVLLALTMNGETLPRDHGYPVRVIAPGTASLFAILFQVERCPKHAND